MHWRRAALAVAAFFVCGSPGTRSPDGFVRLVPWWASRSSGASDRKVRSGFRV